jgi:flagellar biosynthesis/type III secretory pathway protein FliH
MATIAEEWVREGLQQGLQQGRQQGLQQGIPQGEALLLRRQLTCRFGPLPAWVEAQLQKAESAQLEVWAERVLNAPTLEAVFEIP